LLFSATSRGFGYGYEAVRIRVKKKIFSLRHPEFIFVQNFKGSFGLLAVRIRGFSFTSVL
jgi:hypothetical protein